MHFYPKIVKASLMVINAMFFERLNMEMLLEFQETGEKVRVLI